MVETVYQIRSLWPPLDVAFSSFYEALHGQRLLDERGFDQVAIPYLLSIDKEWGKHDTFFNNFTPMWQTHLATNNHEQGRALWKWALRPVFAAEASSPTLRVHKGSAYYFWAITEILAGDMDRGYSLMHAALEEDVKTHQRTDPATPSYRLAVLDGHHPEQLFRPWVAALGAVLDQRIAAYRSRTGRHLTGDDFRTRFLSETSVQDAAFLFSFTLARLTRIVELSPRQTGPFASQLLLNILFDLCLVVDAAIQHKRSSSSRRFIDLAANLSSEAGLGLSKSTLQAINGQFKQDFEGALRQAAGGTMVTDGGTLSGPASSLAVVYGLRNRGAHAPAAVPFVAEGADQLVDHTLDVLFLLVESLY